MDRIFTFVLAAGLGLFQSPLVQAQAFDGCDIEPSEYSDIVAPSLVGDWSVENGTGMTWIFENGVQMMSMPMPPEAPDTATIDLREGVLFMSGAEFQNLRAELIELDGEEPGIPVPTGISGDLAARFIDFDTVGSAPNCSETLLPVLYVEGAIPMPEAGGNMGFQGYYFVLSDLVMSGVALFDGGMDGMEMHARRFMTLRRN